MQLPDYVRRVVEERAEAVGFPALQRAAAAMSQAYRGGQAIRAARLSDTERVAAYLATRMPATYAAAHAVLREVRARLGAAPVASVLDLGAGTGAASLAAREWFPEARITMWERDPALAAAAREWLPEAAQIAGDLTRTEDLPPHDLVIAAYVLGELPSFAAAALWRAARVALAVIEPGTPAGFALLRQRVRDPLLGSGARMLAPCPHESECPLRDPDWCHFAARVERSGIHRRLKGAELNYEDEKFSYVALARQPPALADARIIRRPAHNPGLVTLEICAPSGLRAERVTKRDRDAFRAARHAAWGDPWRAG